MKVKLITSLAVSSMVALFVVSVTLSLTRNYPQLPTPAKTVTVVPPLTTKDVLTDVNNERVKAGEQPFTEDVRLDASAAAKCADMQAHNYVAHQSPSGEMPLDFIKASVGSSKSFAYGENLSWNYQDAQAAVTGWMGSSGHRANILNAKFTEVGYAICNVNSSYKNVIVQHFLGE